MGKASSAKKVARAARAGGSLPKKRKLAAFPLAIALIVVLGVALVAYAINSGDITIDAKNPPQVQQDHWHAAYGVYLCDYFSEALNDKGADLNGIHTHGDSLLHIHPQTAAVSGRNATLGVFFDQVGAQVNDDRIELPDGRTFKAGETTCNGKPADVRVAHWEDARTAPSADEPDEVTASGFSDIRLSEDLGAYTVAFVPEGAEIPPPPEAERICEDALADSGGQPTGECTTAGADQLATEEDPGTSTTSPPDSTTESTPATEPTTTTAAP